MTREEMRSAALYWDKQEASAVQMERGPLLAEMETFIRAHNTCALATGAGDYVRCTPIEYNYKDGHFWLFTEGGHKFTGLAENDNVSLAIYDPYEGFGTVAGMQVTGKARLIELWSEAYLDLLAFKNFSPEALKKQPHQLHLIEVVPTRIDFLSAALKKQGFDSRQHLTFD